MATVRDGVIDFVSLNRDDRGDLSGFAYQWNALIPGSLAGSVVYNITQEEARRTLLELTGLDEAWFKGKRCLDTGCGHGQYARALASMGAEVMGVDLSEVVYRCMAERPAERYPGRPPLYIRADALRCPLVGGFDLVLSFGIAHHTPDPKGAVQTAARLVAPGGVFVLCIYEKWKIGYVTMREVFPLPHYLPRPLLLGFCKAAALPVAFYLAGREGRLPRAQTFRTAAFGLHDAYSPTHSRSYKAEVPMRWMEEAGLTDLKHLTRCIFRGRRPEGGR